MPGLPKKVGKSADMVWVRSIALVKLRRGASAARQGAAANPAAAAPLKTPRRVSASRTACSHPVTHIVSPSADRGESRSPTVAQLSCRRTDDGNRRADAGPIGARASPPALPSDAARETRGLQFKGV